MFQRSALLVVPIVAIVSSSLTFLVLDHNPEFSNRSGMLVNGMKYHGKLENGLLQGRGSIHGPGTEKYTGRFVDGVLQGEGEYLDAVGGYYKGGFRDGMRHGTGQYTYFDGSEYFGTFVNNMSDGTGELTTADGNHYKGDFFRNFMHGEGVFNHKTHGVYEGSFEENIFVEGVATVHDYVMKGSFSDWQLEGQQNSFIKAFYKANEYVRDWEDTDFPDAKHSEPQISIGSRISTKLKSWNHQLGG